VSLDDPDSVVHDIFALETLQLEVHVHKQGVVGTSLDTSE
jgi:hypothetical protein